MDFGNRRRSVSCIIMLIAIIIMMTQTSEATNGYFRHGYGTKNKAMAGVGVAFPLSTIIPATNPAGMTFLGNRYDISIAIFNPNREYTITGNPSGFPGTFPLTPGTIESDSKFFVIPAFGANWMLSANDAVGISLFGNGGMNTDYGTKTFNHPMLTVSQPTGVDLMQLFAGLTYARKIHPLHSIGLTGLFCYQRFRAQGLQAFSGFSRSPENLSDNDHAGSTGFGVRIGYMGNILPVLAIGASYQSKMFMTELEEYAGLFAEQGGFSVPSNFTVGFAFDISPTVTAAFDLQQIFYSDIKSVNNPMNPANFQTGILLGDDKGSGFGWEDMTVYKLGAQWKASKDMSFRAGYSFSAQPIPESEVMFNILAPGVIEQHITFGLSKQLGRREINIAVMHAFSNEVSGYNPMEAPGQQTIALKMNQWELDFGVSF